MYFPNNERYFAAIFSGSFSKLKAIPERVSCKTRHVGSMGRTSREKASERKDKTEKSKKKNDLVPKYSFFPKQSLAAYPDPEGNPVYIGEAGSMSEKLAVSSILASRNPKNTELLARPGMAMVFATAAIDHGIRELKKQQKDSTLQEVLKFFDDKAGKKFLHAVKSLNVGPDGTASKHAVKKAVASYVQFLGKENDDFHEALVELVALSGRLYLAGMYLLEHRSFITRPKVWAKKWARAESSPDAIHKWLKRPDKEEHLIGGIYSLLQDKLCTKKGKEKKRSKKKSSSSETADSNGVASPSRSPSKASSQASRAKSSSSARSSSPEPSKKKAPKVEKHPKAEKKEKKHKRADEAAPKAKPPSSERGISPCREKPSKSNADKRPKTETGTKKARNEEEKDKPKHKVPTAKPTLQVASEDEDTSSEVEVAHDYLQWPLADVQTFAKEIQAASKAALHPKGHAERITLQWLVSILDNVPETLLASYGYTEVLKKLKEMSRMPRITKVTEILGEMQKLSDAAIAKHIEAGGEPKATDAALEDAKEEDTKESEEENDGENKDAEEK